MEQAEARREGEPAVEPPTTVKIFSVRSTLEATQGQIDGFSSQLLYKYHQNRVAFVGGWLEGFGLGCLQAGAERRGNHLRGFEDFYLNARARIWPRLSYMRSTADMPDSAQK